MKKYIALVMILCFAFVILACGESSLDVESNDNGVDEEVVLVLGNMAYGADNPYNIACKKAAELLEEMGSTVKLNLQLEAVLGTERELIENTIMGNVDLVQGADMSFTPFCNKLAFANFPLIFDDYDDVYQHWSQDGWVFKEADKYLADVGMKLLGATDNGFRWITNSKRPVQKLSDIKGLKVRVPEVESLIDIWDAFGAVTAPISYTELTTALQQGVVDGQELGMQHFYTLAWYEYQPFATTIDYDYSAVITCMNLDKFNSLSAKQRSDIEKAFQEASEYTTGYAIDFINEGFSVSEAHGVEILERTQEMYDEIYEIGVELATSPKWLSVFGEELVEKMYPGSLSN